MLIDWIVCLNIMASAHSDESNSFALYAFLPRFHRFGRRFAPSNSLPSTTTTSLRNRSAPSNLHLSLRQSLNLWLAGQLLDTFDREVTSENAKASERPLPSEVHANVQEHGWISDAGRGYYYHVSVRRWLSFALPYSLFLRCFGVAIVRLL